MNTPKTSSRRSRLLVPALAVLAIAGGCQMQSQYTKEHMSTAKQKMSLMKSATEWEMARQAFLAGDLQKALRGVDQSITINDTVPKSHVLRGRILTEMGNLEDAVTAFDTAIKLDEKHTDAYYFKGLAFERFSQPERALPEYRKAEELDPSNASYVVATAETLADLGRVEEAHAYLTERRGRFEHNAGIRQTLGHLELIRGQSDAAVTLFSEAHLLAPDDKSVLEDLIRAQIETGKFADADANLARLLTNDELSKRRDLRHMRVKCLTNLNRSMEARQILIGLTEGPDGAADTEAWIGLGKVAFELKDTNRLRQAATRVIANEPDRPEGYMLRGLLERRQGNLAAASNSVAQALSIQRDTPTLVLLGMINHERGDNRIARMCFEEALKITPNDPTATQLLANLDSGSRITGAESAGAANLESR